MPSGEPAPRPELRQSAPRPSALARLIAAVLDHRLAAGLGLAALVLLAVLGALRLRIDFSSAGFYGDDSEAAARLAEYHGRWGVDDDELLILISPVEAGAGAPGPGPGVLAPERLAAIAALGEALEQREGVVGVRSIATLELPAPPELGAGAGELLPFPQLVARARLGEDSMRGQAARALVLPRLPVVPRMLAPDASLTVLVAELAYSSDDVLRAHFGLAELERALLEHDERLREAGLERALAGVPAVRAGFVGLVIRDQLRLVPASLALMALCLWLLFRRLHGVLIPALAAGLPTAMLVGLMGWTGEAIGLLNQTYFTLLPMIAVADAIHMVARYHEARAQLGVGPAARREAIILAGSRVGLACTLTTLTTAAGFASLGLARMPILRAFGLYAALGVVLALLIVVVLVPLLLSLSDAEQPARELPGARVVEGLVELGLRRPRLSVGACAALLGLALIPASRVVVDNQLSGLLVPEHPTRLASARVDAELGGVLGLELELHAPPGLDLRAPELLAATRELERWLAARPEVREVSGLAGALEALAELEGAGGLPRTQAELDARLEALARVAALERWVSPDGAHMRVHAGVPDIGGVAYLALAEAAEAELRAQLEALAAAQPRAAELRSYATGTALVAYRGVNGITADLRRSFALVFGVVLLLIVALFRSPWPALVATLPNGAPLLLGYASVGLVGVTLDPLAAVILTLALGIAVDDTLHILVRTREERAAGFGVEESLRRAASHSGRAVVVTTLVVVAGLGLNTMASFPPLQLLGLLGAVILSFALLLDLLVLPALIVLLGGRGL